MAPEYLVWFCYRSESCNISNNEYTYLLTGCKRCVCVISIRALRLPRLCTKHICTTVYFLMSLFQIFLTEIVRSRKII